MTDRDSRELPQFPNEQSGDCPVCGEQYFRYEATPQAQSKEGSVPFCIKTMDSINVIEVYYHD